MTARLEKRIEPSSGHTHMTMAAPPMMTKADARTRLSVFAPILPPCGRDSRGRKCGALVVNSLQQHEHAEHRGRHHRGREPAEQLQAPLRDESAHHRPV